jgi:F0F1-type ATP synthase assembly protein I
MGIEIAVAVVGCLLAGWWADGKLGTSPYLTLVGVVLGTAVAGRTVWRAAKQAAEED